MGIKNLDKVIDSGYIVTIDSDGNINFGNCYKYDVLKITPDFKLIPEVCDSKADGFIEVHSKLTALILNGSIREIIESKDEYKNLINVYTYRDGKVLKDKCEKFGYPEVTISGKLMYDNTHFLTRKEALIYCRREEHADLRMTIKYELRDYWKSTKNIFKRFFLSTIYYLRSTLFFGY